MNLLNKSKLATVFFGGLLCGGAYLVSCGQVNINSAGAGGALANLKVKANGVEVGTFVSLNFDTQSSTNNILF